MKRKREDRMGFGSSKNTNEGTTPTTTTKNEANNSSPKITESPSSPPRKDSAQTGAIRCRMPQNPLPEHMPNATEQETHANNVDGDSTFRDWLREFIVEDFNGVLDPHDVLQALDAKHVSEQGWREGDELPPSLISSGLSYCCVLALVLSAHPTATLRERIKAHPFQPVPTGPLIYGVRYCKLDPNCTNNVALGFMESIRTNAHKLLYLPQPLRTVAWLRMYFRADAAHSVSGLSMWAVYDQAFQRSYDTHKSFDEDDFLMCVRKTIRGSEEIEVSEGHFVMQGVKLRSKPLHADIILANFQQKALHCLAKMRLIDGPEHGNNEFTRKLLADPLIPLSRYNIGPMVARLRCRAVGGPLGDEEPGFPGVSLKTIQRKVKKDMDRFLKDEDKARAQRLDDHEAEACKMVVKEIRKREKSGEVKADKRPTAEEWKRAADELLKSV